MANDYKSELDNDEFEFPSNNIYEDESKSSRNDDYIVDTLIHFRKIFEKNVVQVQRSRYFLSLPYLRTICGLKTISTILFKIYLTQTNSIILKKALNAASIPKI